SEGRIGLFDRCQSYCENGSLAAARKKFFSAGFGRFAWTSCLSLKHKLPARQNRQRSRGRFAAALFSPKEKAADPALQFIFGYRNCALSRRRTAENGQSAAPRSAERMDRIAPMSKQIILITGGARSGKSKYAEDRIVEMGRRRLYLATAEAKD